MDNEFFLDGTGIQPLLHFDQPPMSTWHPLPPPDLHFPPTANAQGSSAFFFESTLSSTMVSSPASVSNSAISSDRFVIGKLRNSGEISPAANAPLAGASSPCVTPINSFYCSPPAHPGNSIASDLPTMPGDPGFAARAARFSSFRSRSFNCRTTQSGLQNGSGFASNSGPTQLKPGRKLQRVLSSPSLKVENGSSAFSPGCETQIKVNGLSRNCGFDQGQFGNSRENSSGCETGSGPPGNDLGSASKKRKSAPNKGKSKQIPSSPTQTIENRNDSNPKRIKSGQKEGNNTTNDEKPSEQPKDYIHVRARRGQATDSHSLAERVRREKIGERMKLLQDIVPGCNKVTGKALMLEEIINYVQSLQRQVEFLSMKLASMPPIIDFSTSNPFKNDIYQQNCSTSSMQQLGALAPNLYGVQMQQNGTLNQSHEAQLPPNDGFFNGVAELHSVCEGDLHMIVEMGFSDNTIYTGR